jgi:hypothetical protein
MDAACVPLAPEIGVQYPKLTGLFPSRSLIRYMKLQTQSGVHIQDNWTI